MIAIICSLSVMAGSSPTITLNSLLAEMCDRDRLARFPNPPYQSLQASSYNRESVHRDKPGWFADSDGTGYIREETINGKREYVMMEHTGPGCITKIWTPFFYYDFNNRVGPNVRIYLDGSLTPTFDESLIKMVRGEGSIPPPFAQPTARAGDSYLPIPFAKSVKVTMVDKPFYNIINYRAYPAETKVKTFKKPSSYEGLLFVRQALYGAGLIDFIGSQSVAPKKAITFRLPGGPHSVTQLRFQVGGLEMAAVMKKRPNLYRSIVVSATFDGEETIWCPVGDLFSQQDVEPRSGVYTFNRALDLNMILNMHWTMPYKKSAVIKVFNLSNQSADLGIDAPVKPWKWTKDSMHFYAPWRPDAIVPGTPSPHWNFSDIPGKGA